MDPTFQSQTTSFIPRKPVGRESSIREKPVGVFMIIATIVFAVAILGSGGAYLYKYLLSKSIDTSGKYLDERKAALEPTTINDLLRMDKRFRASNELLNNHIVVNPIFTLLEGLTLKTVRFTQMEYSNSEKGVSVKVSGQAKSYGSVALQADTLNGEKRFIKSAVFSGLNLDDRGNVSFSANIMIDPDLINYKKFLARGVSLNGPDLPSPAGTQ